MKDRKPATPGPMTARRHRALVFAAFAVVLVGIGIQQSSGFVVSRSKLMAILQLFCEGLKLATSYLDTKKLLLPAISQPFEHPWQEPKSSEELFGGSTKILWGYWNTGIDGLPAVYKDLFLRSWKVHNPDWTLVILDDANFHDFVSVNDLPTTFRSLSTQNKSDLIRMAVLLRYGGVYMDISTVVFKGFNHIWATVPDDKLLIVETGQRENDVRIVNNALLMTKGTGNSVLRLWQNRVKDYLEHPNLTPDEMKQDLRFSRIKDSWLANEESTLPYFADLYILYDLIWHNDQNATDHVLLLPGLRWGFWFSSVPYHVRTKSEQYDETVEALNSLPEKHDELLVALRSPVSLVLGLAKALIPPFVTMDYDMARYLFHQVHALKFSNEELGLVELWTEFVEENKEDNTLFYLTSAATDISVFPIEQASIEDAIRPPSFAI